MKIKRLGSITILIILISLASTQALMISSVSTSPNEIVPGEVSTIKIGIENDGDKDIEDVSVSLDLAEVPFAPYDSSSEYNIDEIRDGKVKYAEFEIIALSGAESGIYKIPIEITYKEEGENEKITKNSLISLTVNSKPIIGVGIEDGLLLKSQENEVNIKVINKGLSDVKFLEVRLGSSTYFDVLSSKNVYIGDVDSDDFDTAKFKIFFKENAPNSINLPVRISYKDALNNEQTEEFSLQIKVYTKKKAIELGLLEKSNTLAYVSVAIAVVVIWIVYRKIKKRRKLKKAKADSSV